MHISREGQITEPEDTDLAQALRELYAALVRLADRFHACDQRTDGRVRRQEGVRGWLDRLYIENVVADQGEQLVTDAVELPGGRQCLQPGIERTSLPPAALAQQPARAARTRSL